MKIIEYLKKKIYHNGGESIAETLVALLIAAVGLVMLAAMITSGTRLVQKSQKKMNTYYQQNNVVAGENGNGSEMTIKIQENTGTQQVTQEFAVEYYENDTLSGTSVISYRLPKPSTP